MEISRFSRFSNSEFFNTLNSGASGGLKPSYGPRNAFLKVLNGFGIENILIFAQKSRFSLLTVHQYLRLHDFGSFSSNFNDILMVFDDFRDFRILNFLIPLTPGLPVD